MIFWIKFGVKSGRRKILGKYKIQIQVFHGGSSCNFVFWNRECELLLGLSAAPLRHTMIKDGIDDPLEFPLALDQLLNLEMAFKDLEITSKHNLDPTTPIGNIEFPEGSSELTTS
ncbi:hypothetical protein RYX36_035306 [Vicia faba]